MALALGAAALVVPGQTRAGPKVQSDVVQNPYYEPSPDPVVIDVSNGPVVPRETPSPIDVHDLDRFRSDTPVEPDLDAVRDGLPEGFTQVGGMIVPEEMLDGADMVPDADLDLAARPRTRKDIEEICAYPDAVPPGVYDYNPRPGMERPRFHTVFLNYNGGILNSGGENSAENLSGIARSGHMFPVYAGGEMRAIAAAQAVQADFADWAIRVAYMQRPPKVLPYTMVMVGGSYTDTTAGPSGGVAPLDCEDFGQRNVCFAFQNQAPATSQANVISQEIGHTLGLGHTSASDSVMAAGYAPTQSGDLGLNDSCAPTVQVSGQGAACVGVNKCHCGVGDQQHDKNTLFAVFSPAGVDMVEPTIELLQPADGSVFQEDDEIVVEFEPWDDVGGYGWKLEVEDESGEIIVDQVDYDRALMFTLKGLPPGFYTLRGLIQDHADHIATHEIGIEILGPQGGATGTGTGGGADGGGTGTDGTGGTTGADTGAESDTDTDDPGLSGDDGGCGCTTASNGDGWSANLLALGLLGLRRRRMH